MVIPSIYCVIHDLIGEAIDGEIIEEDVDGEPLDEEAQAKESGNYLLS
jgi:hypothetical protein